MPPFDESEQPAHSGSRLKLRWYVWDDGTAQWERTQFFDVQRSEWCFPRPWDDGGTYCTPTAEEGVYADAACTTALVPVDPGLGYLPPYVTYGNFVTTPNNGGYDVTVSSLHQLADKAATPADAYRMIDGACAPGFLVSGFDYYAAGSEVSRSDLVALTETSPDPTQRLSVVHRTSEDGLDVPYALRDTTLDLDCAPSAQPGAPTTQCEPLDAVAVDEYADPMCTHALVSTWGTTPAPLAAIADSPGCRTFYPIGTRVTPTTAYGLAGTCTPKALEISDNYFDAGPALALATASRDVQAEAGRRLQRILVAGLDDAFLHDTMTGVDCARIRGDADPFTCDPVGMPNVGPITSAFSDPACTMPANFAYIAPRTCAAAAQVISDKNASYQVLGPVPVLYQAYPGSPQPCAVMVPVPIAGYDVFQVGSAMPFAPPLSGHIVDVR